MRRLVGLDRSRGQRHTCGDDVHVARSERARDGDERLRRADHEPGATHQPPGEPRSPPRKLGVRPPELEHKGLPGREGGKRGREPVGVHQVCAVRRAPRSQREGGEERGHEERLPGGAPEVPDDAVTVCEAEVPERGRRHDVNLHSRLAQVLDCVPDEHPGDVIRAARIGRRQDEDPHSRRGRAAITGSVTASVAKT